MTAQLSAERGRAALHGPDQEERGEHGIDATDRVLPDRIPMPNLRSTPNDGCHPHSGRRQALSFDANRPSGRRYHSQGGCEERSEFDVGNLVKPFIHRSLARFGSYHAWRLGVGYLKEIGWIRSIVERRPVDASGRQVPYFTYPAIDLLGARLPRDAHVFEWGSGASTVWFAQRCAEVHSCEHDPMWLEANSSALPANATIVLRSLGSGDYEREIHAHAPYDLVVIDGRHRVSCAHEAVESLTERGVIVWDNSERAALSRGTAVVVGAWIPPHRSDRNRSRFVRAGPDLPALSRPQRPGALGAHRPSRTGAVPRERGR